MRIYDRTGEVWARAWDGEAYSHGGETVAPGETYDIFVIVGPPVERDAWVGDDELVHPCVRVFQLFATYDVGEIAKIAEERLKETGAQRLA